MTLTELIAKARLVAGDTASPPFWTDAQWADRLSEAEEEAAIRARLLEDDQITATVTAGDPYVTYPVKAWAIQRVFFAGRRLELVDREMLELSEGEQWEDQTGDPRACYEIGGQLRLYPTPTAGGDLRMVAFCVPEAALTTDDMNAEPAIPARLHRHLVDWAVAMAYQDEDADAFNPTKAAAFEAKFERQFGPKPDQVALRRRRINVRRKVAGAYF